MLTSLSDILGKAKEGHYGVPAILTCNLMTVQAVIAAAEEERSPVILLCGGGQAVDLD